MNGEKRPILLLSVRALSGSATDQTDRVPADVHRAVRIVQASAHRVVVEDDTGRRTRRRQPQKIQMEEAGRLLAAGPLATTSVDVVALGLDELAVAALWHAVQECPDVLAVATVDAAERAVAALASGRTAQEILAPRGFSATRVLSGLGATQDAPDDVPRVHLVALGTNPGNAWLGLTTDTAEVDLGMVDAPARSTVNHVATSPGARDAAHDGTAGHLIIGPANSAGQGHAWAVAVTEHLPGWTAESLHVYSPTSKLSFTSDVPVTTLEWQRPAARLRLALDSVLPATHVLLESGRPILGTSVGGRDPDAWDAEAAASDVEAIRRSGRSVAALFHGSEVRDPHLHADLEPWSPFRDPNLKILTQRLATRVAAVRRAIGQRDDLVRFVSTPDLIDYLPGARWLPVVVGGDAFAAGPPALRSSRPVIAHAPTHSALKGSEWIDPVLQALDNEGVITYRRFGSLPAFGVMRALRGADALVDQVVLGNPGVLAAQALAAGRLVLSHIPESVRRRFPQPPPVLEVTPETLDRTVRSIAAAPEAYSALAAAGPTFARTFHDGRYSARVLAEEFLQ